MRNVTGWIVTSFLTLGAFPALANPTQPATRLVEKAKAGLPDGRYRGTLEGLDGYEFHASVVRGFLVDAQIRYGDGLGKTAAMLPMNLYSAPLIGMLTNFDEGYIRVMAEVKGLMGVGSFESTINGQDTKGRFIVHRI